MLQLLEIVGQDGAIAQLQRALAGARRPHAYLFVGPQGVGRRTTALALAAAQLCQKPVVVANRLTAQGPRDEPFALSAEPRPAGLTRAGLRELPQGFELRQACGLCRDCKSIAAGTHGDLQLVYKELAQYHPDPQVRSRKMQELGIDVIRDFLIAPAGRISTSGRGKVFIILEAELMSDAAQNALLKTLEEPPSGVTIILIAERAEELLPTTLSRCWPLRFGLLPGEFVMESLAAQDVPQEQARFWADFTGGSVGRATRLHAQKMYGIKQDIVNRLSAVSPAGDSDLGEYLSGVMKQLAEAAVAEVKAAEGGELAATLASRRAVGTMLELIAAAYRDAMHLACRRQAPQPAAGQLVYADQPDAIERIASRFSPAQLAEILEQLGEYERLLWRNVNPKVVWDNLVITCASAAPLRV